MIQTIKQRFQAGSQSIHVSVDDAIWSLARLFTTRPASIFDDDYFRFWRDLHVRHGVVVTHFLMEDNSGLVDSALPFSLYGFDPGDSWWKYYQQELAQNQWLRWGIHAKNQDTPMTCQSMHEIEAMLTQMGRWITDFTSQQGLPSAWRPHFYVASWDACKLMRDRGVEVLLTPDDNRLITACLPPSLAAQMAQGGKIIKDQRSGLLCVHSSTRLERATVKETKATIERELGLCGLVALFTHEHELLPVGGGWGENWQTRRRDLAEIIEFASRLGNFVQ